MKNKTISGKQAIWYRNYRRARDRAMVRLTHAYPETYKELLEQEKASDVSEGKNYIAVDDNSGITVGFRTESGESNRPTAEYHKEDEGDQ